MGTTLFVKGLPWETTEHDLRELFGQHGTVESVKILTERDTGRSRGIGFVEMASDEQAQNAMRKLDGATLGTRWLSVTVARPKGEEPPREASRRHPEGVPPGGVERRSGKDRRKNWGPLPLERPFYGEKKSFGERKSFGEKKPWHERKGEYGVEKKPWEKKPWGDKKPGGFRKKPWGERPPREGAEKKPWGEKKPFEKKPWEKKPWGDKKPGGFGPKKFGDKPGGFKPKFGDKPRFGDKPKFGGKPGGFKPKFGRKPGGFGPKKRD